MLAWAGLVMVVSAGAMQAGGSSLGPATTTASIRAAEIELQHAGQASSHLTHSQSDTLSLSQIHLAILSSPVLGLTL